MDPDRREHDVVEHAHVREEVVLLEDDPHPGADGVGIDPGVGDVLPVEMDRPVVDDLEQVDAPQEGRLARPRGTDEDDALPLVEREVQVVEDEGLPERLPHAADVEQAHTAPPETCIPWRRASQSVNRAIGTVRQMNRTPATTYGV